jgi:hypothetical protein
MDNFSSYQILKKKYIKDVETLLLRYYEPEENKEGGKFPRKNRIKIKN